MVHALYMYMYFIHVHDMYISVYTYFPKQLYSIIMTGCLSYSFPSHLPQSSCTYFKYLFTSKFDERIMYCNNIESSKQ